MTPVTPDFPSAIKQGELYLSGRVEGFIAFLSLFGLKTVPDLDDGIDIRPPSNELHLVGLSNIIVKSLVVCLVFYRKFYCPSAIDTAASAYIY